MVVNAEGSNFFFSGLTFFISTHNAFVIIYLNHNALAANCYIYLIHCENLLRYWMPNESSFFFAKESKSITTSRW